MTRSARPLCVALLLVLVALVYWPGLSGGFIFDDFPNILANPAVQVASLDVAVLVKAAFSYEPGLYGRPLAMMGFAIDHALGGKQPFGYKLHSLLIHLVNVLLVWALVGRLLARLRAGWTSYAACAIALLWAIHPLQVSSVLYVVQRMELLATTFVLIALLAYLRGRERQLDGRQGWHWLAMSAFAAVVGMLAKESAVLFPLFALGLELTLFKFNAQRTAVAVWLRRGYWLGGLAGLALYLGWLVPLHLAPEIYANRDFSLVERLLTQLRVLPMYLGQILLPLPSSLTFYYDHFEKSTGLLQPVTTLLGGLLIVGLLALAWVLRTRLPLFALGVFWFFASHFLTSNVINLELVFEHRNYFAILGVLLSCASLVSLLKPRDGPGILRAGVAAVIVGFGMLAVLRSATWGDDLLLAQALADLSPGSVRAVTDLGAVYGGMAGSSPESPFYQFAQTQFSKASSMPGSSALPEQASILLAASSGATPDQAMWDRMLWKVRNQPPTPQTGMAVIGLLQRRYEGIPLDDERLSSVLRALAESMSQPDQWLHYGDFALAVRGDKSEALDAYLHYVRLRRDMAEIERQARRLDDEGHFDIAAAMRRAASG